MTQQHLMKFYSSKAVFAYKVHQNRSHFRPLCPDILSRPLSRLEREILPPPIPFPRQRVRRLDVWSGLFKYDHLQTLLPFQIQTKQRCIAGSAHGGRHHLHDVSLARHRLGHDATNTMQQGRYSMRTTTQWRRPSLQRYRHA